MKADVFWFSITFNVGTMEDTYDTVILKLLDEHMRMKRIDFFVEAQHEKAKEGKFVELD